MTQYEFGVIDAVDSGIIIVDEELNIRVWNSWMEMTTGVSRNDATSKKLYEAVDIEPQKLTTLLRNIKTSTKLNIMTFMPPATHGYLIKTPLKNLFSSFYKVMQQEIKIIPLDPDSGLISIHINDQTAMMESQKMLELYNKNLEQMVKEETEKRMDSEKALMEQSKMALMGDMIQAIAHQWRQPLNALGLYIQDVPAAYKVGEINKEYVENFKNGAMNIVQAMSRTIDDFRNFFAPNKTKQTFCIEEALEDTLRIVSVQMQNHFIDVNFEHKQKHHTIGYKNELEQVFLNLISNAKDAIIELDPKEMFINISIESDDQNIIINFEDSGGGIPDEIMSRIFEPYFTTKEQGKGTGIGLYMSKEIIERHLHGKLSVSNGKYGAKFTIELPKTTA
jgi:C4-dicarboxylate-specific signal transduction histidine kinase